MVNVQQCFCYGSHRWGVGALLISGGTAPNTADLNLLGTITGRARLGPELAHTGFKALTAESSSEKSLVLPTFRDLVGEVLFPAESCRRCDLGNKPASCFPSAECVYSRDRWATVKFAGKLGETKRGRLFSGFRRKLGRVLKETFTGKEGLEAAAVSRGSVVIRALLLGAGKTSFFL